MKKRILFAIGGIILVVGALGGIKGLQIERMIAYAKQFSPPPEIVTTAPVQTQTWESVLTSVGSLEAVQGVMVTAELTGKVVMIAFEPGTSVQAGDLLVQQDISSENTQLQSAEATRDLAHITLERAEKLLPDKVATQSDVDNKQAQFKKARAEVENIRTIIAKKTIRAPFDGRLGLRHVNIGQIIDAGQAIVSLQSLDPIFVNFLLPQRQIDRIKTGLTVRVVTDALPGKSISGMITAINPEVDAATRNIRLQATVGNHEEHLRPGMFVNVELVLPAVKQALVIPATSVLFAPYSDSVFVVETKQDDKTNQTTQIVRRQFVKLGEKRGDFVEILSGLTKDQVVVSTGVFKLLNGQTVVVDNKLAPEFKLTPVPENS